MGVYKTEIYCPITYGGKINSSNALIYKYMLVLTLCIHALSFSTDYIHTENTMLPGKQSNLILRGKANITDTCMCHSLDIFRSSSSRSSWMLKYSIGWRAQIAQIEHTCKKREIAEIYLRKFFWIFRKSLGREREIDTAPKPSPEVAPSKMEVAPS